MSATQTKIFGMSLGVDPKLIVLGLIVVAGVIYYFTSDSSGDNGGSHPVASTAPVVARPPANLSLTRAVPDRRAKSATDRNTLKLIPVDGRRGDVDPTLRLGLLDRVKNIPPAAGLRNLFEAGGAVAVAGTMPPVPKNAPKIIPTPPVTQTATLPATPPAPPPFVIPLKYYGFVRPSGRAVDGNRGFFMDGDSILIGAEGDLLEKRFLIVALTPNTARLEDTQKKQGQDLPVTPEAPATQ